MPFVKLDCRILDSSVWHDTDARIVFITALLMAEPYELPAPEEQIAVRTLDRTGFVVPAGWYGLVRAAASGIARRAGISEKLAFSALERLGAADLESRSPEHDGRRLVRVSGGYLVLNFDRYRQKDTTAAERAKRYRESHAASRRDDRDATRDVTHAGSTKQKAEEVLPSGEARTRPRNPQRRFDEVSPAMILASTLRDCLRSRITTFREPDLQRWAAGFDLLLRVDRRDQEEALRVISYAVEHKPRFFQSPGAFRGEWPDGSNKYDSILIAMTANAEQNARSCEPSRRDIGPDGLRLVHDEDELETYRLRDWIDTMRGSSERPADFDAYVLWLKRERAGELRSDGALNTIDVFRSETAQRRTA